MTDGYDSDDSDGEQSSSHRKQWKKTDEDEDDMFAAGDEKEDKEDRPKEPRFLKLADIDGQEFGERSQWDDGGDDSRQYNANDEDLEHDEDPEYAFEQARKSTRFEDANADAERTPPSSPGGGERDASHRKKQGMGYRIEKFNMKEEMASGQFDEDGNYIRNKRDEFAQNDRWLEGHYNRKSIHAASDAQRRRHAAEKAREEKTAAEFPTMEHAFKGLAELLEPGETVLDALHRLGAAAKRAKKGSAEEAYAASQALDDLTHVSGVLMSEYGQTNVYDEVYEGLVRMVRRAGLVDNAWDPARRRAQESSMNSENTSDAGRSDAQWEYKWTPAYLERVPGQDAAVTADQTFGPFSASDLAAWAQQGFFGPDKEFVVVRRASDASAPWTPWTDAGLP